MEFCFRAFYKPLGHFRDKWMWVGRKVLSGRDGVPLNGRAAEDRASAAMPIERKKLLETVPIKRWVEFRQAAVQERLLACRFFTWPFFLELVRRAHPIFQQEVLAVNAALGFTEDDLLRKEKRWAHTDLEDVLRGVDAKPVPYEELSLNVERWYTLPWFRIKKGVSFPGKCLQPPWPEDVEMLLRWLTRSGAGRARDGTPKLMAVDSAVLHEAVKLRREPIVFFFAINGATDITTEILRSSLYLEPFSFNITQNLLVGANDEEKDKDRLDTMDNFVWQWIDGLKEEEEIRYKQRTHELTAEECLSPARWLQRQLQWAREDKLGDPYFPISRGFDSFAVELHVRSDQQEQAELDHLRSLRTRPREEARGTILDEFLFGS